MLKKKKAHIQFPKVICRSLLLASGVQCYLELLAILKMDHPQARTLGGFGGFGRIASDAIIRPQISHVLQFLPNRISIVAATCIAL